MNTTKCAEKACEHTHTHERSRASERARTHAHTCARWYAFFS